MRCLRLDVFARVRVGMASHRFAMDRRTWRRRGRTVGGHPPRAKDEQPECPDNKEDNERNDTPELEAEGPGTLAALSGGPLDGFPQSGP